MSGDKGLAEFLEILDAWNIGYTRVLCKYFVSKKSGNKHLLYGMVALTNEKFSENQKKIHIETRQCIAGQEVFDLTSKYYCEILATLKNNPHIFNTEKQRFQLPISKKESCSTFFDPLSFPLIKSTMRNPYLRISSGNDSTLFLPDKNILDLELRTIDTPYEDTRDLFLFLGFSPEILDTGRIPHIDYIATMPIKNMTCEIEDRRKLHLKFYFPNLPQKEKFKVGVRLFLEDRSDPRFSINGADFIWSKEVEIHIASLTKEFENLDVARVFPSYDGHNIGNYVAVDPKFVANNRLEVDTVFYENNSVKSLLSSKNADEFEFGVSTLLHYFKLSIQRYSGVRSLEDGPDVVAFSNSGHIYIIECTLGTPNHKGKLHKLHTRAEKVRKRYQEKGLNQDLIRPVMVTNLPKENTVEDISDLANYKISLVTKDDFEELISRISNPPSDQELFEAAINAIPSKKPEQQIPLDL